VNKSIRKTQNLVEDLSGVTYAEERLAIWDDSFSPDSPDPEAVDVVNPATATQSSAGKKKVANSKQDASNFSTTDASKVKQASLGGYKTDAGLGFAKKKKKSDTGLGV
jgi:hypothetical protein